MARIRTIKPEFFTSEDIVSLSPLARLLYVALWCEADKEGRMVWKPATFKLRYLPGDSTDVQALCQELVDAGLIVLYGEGYAYIPSFKSHQHINPRESDSQLPEPNASARVGTRQPRVNSGIDPQVGREGKGKERKGKDDASRFDAFWDAWPKSERKQDKAKCAEKWQAQGLDAVADAILADVATKRKTQKWLGGFIEAPLVYLNNRRWEDGVTPDEQGGSATTDPDSRAAIEAEGKAKGIGPWDETREQWHSYKARVRPPEAQMTLDRLQQLNPVKEAA